MPTANRTLHTYNFGALVCIIAGIPISNYGPDGAVDVELPSDLLESNLSADGYVNYEVNMDDRLDITVRIMETSDALPLLQAAWNLQMLAMREGRNPPPYTFYMRCGSTGDLVEGRMVFVKEPTASKGKSVGTREITIQLPYARCHGLFGATAEGTVQAAAENTRDTLRDTYADTFAEL